MRRERRRIGENLRCTSVGTETLGIVVIDIFGEKDSITGRAACAQTAQSVKYNMTVCTTLRIKYLLLLLLELLDTTLKVEIFAFLVVVTKLAALPRQVRSLSATLVEGNEQTGTTVSEGKRYLSCLHLFLRNMGWKLLKGHI